MAENELAKARAPPPIEMRSEEVRGRWQPWTSLNNDRTQSKCRPSQPPTGPDLPIKPSPSSLAPNWVSEVDERTRPASSRFLPRPDVKRLKLTTRYSTEIKNRPESPSKMSPENLDPEKPQQFASGSNRQGLNQTERNSFRISSRQKECYENKYTIRGENGLERELLKEQRIRAIISNIKRKTNNSNSQNKVTIPNSFGGQSAKKPSDYSRRADTIMRSCER
jgi:hypothetical protein